MTKKTGRPSIPIDDKKSIRFQIRLNKQERLKLESLSEKMNITKGEVLRTLIQQS